MFAFRLLFLLATVAVSVIHCDDVCNTTICQEQSKTYQRIMNASANPCDDFYEYACGNYGKIHPLTEGQQRIVSFIIRNAEMEHEVIDAIKNAADSKSHAVQFVAQLYLECNNTEKLESAGVKPLITEIETVIGGWPLLRQKTNASDQAETKRWPTFFADFVARLGMNAVFGIEIHYNYTSNQNEMIMAPGKIGLTPEIFPDNNTEKYKVAYKKYIRKTAILLGAPDDQQLTTDIEEMFALEERLVKDQFFLDLVEIVQLKTLNSQSVNRIDWVKTLNHIIDQTNSSFKHYTENDYVEIDNYKFFVKAAQILDAAPEKTVQNLFGWAIAMKYGPLTTNKFRQNEFEFNSWYSGTQDQTPHWEACYNFASTQLPYAASRVYVDLHFSPEDKKEATIMVEEIKASFKEILEQNTWLDAETRKSALEKLAAIRENVGYADWIVTDELDKYYHALKDHKVIKDKFFESAVELGPLLIRNALDSVSKPIDHTKLWPMTPLTINAAYMPIENSITIPAAILQPPFFNKNRPFAINYGTIGAVIGHEMTHGFDNLGRRYDKDGKANNWWSDKMLTKFNKLTECFVKQYGSIYVEEVHLNVNGGKTLGENIADNGGVKEGFHAYRNHQAKRGNSQTLPGLKLNSDQLFFLGYANTWCNVVTPDMLRILIHGDVHTPDKYRVNVPLGNLPEFAETFQCAAGTKMNLDNKCAVW